MNPIQKSQKRRARIRYQIRKKLRGTAERPRLVVYRSLDHIYAQLIDDVNSKTLLTVSTKSKDMSDKISSAKGKIEKSKIEAGEPDKETNTVEITKGLTEEDQIVYPYSTLKAGMEVGSDVKIN